MTENTTIIKPQKGYLQIDYGELWKYRELLFFLVWRDIKVRYKQTLIGAAWAIIQPFFTMIVFTVFFGRIAKIPSEGIPYPVFSYSGLLLWTYFSQSLSSSSNSLVGSSNLIKKVYFPRLIIPLSSALSPIVDYLIAMLILILMMFYYGLFPDNTILLLPFILFSTFLLSTGFGFWLSSLNVKFRDVKYVLPFMIQLLLFLTPVIYPPDFLPENYKWVIYLNPISGLVDAHRASLLGYKAIQWEYFIISIFTGAAIFISGLYYFRKTESYFADII